MVIDIDKDDQALVQSISERMADLIPDTAILLERTGGRGWHIWVFVDEWVEAKTARAFLRHSLDGIELTYPVEIYPKQDRLRGGGLGNLVRLPLGVHQRTGKTGLVFNAHMLEFEIEESKNPELPIEPAPAGLVKQMGNDRIEREGLVSYSSDDAPPSTLPCITAYQKGVGEGARDEAMFRLAAYLHRQQIPREAAWVTLEKANENNRPPIGQTDLIAKLDSGYSGAGYGLPCSSDLVGLDTEYCSPSCPVYGTAKGRVAGGILSPTGTGKPKFPRVVERDGIYIYQSRTKSGIREATLSNFTFDVISRLEMPGEGADVLRVRAIAQAGREDLMDIPVTAFSSRAMLIRMLSRAEYAWYGNDSQCQYLKAHLTGGELPTQQAVTKLGRTTIDEEEIWATTNGILSKNGLTSDDSMFTYHRPEHFGIVSVRVAKGSWTLNRTRNALRTLPALNSLGVMVPIIGWTFSSAFKPWFVRSMGHFPLLMLYGTRGAGKTQLISRAILPLFGYSSNEPQIHFCDTTRFVLVSYGASTTTVPLFFDEYRPNALPGTRLRQLWDHWRHLYAEDTDHRGQADLSRLSFKQTAPVIVAGEEMVSDPAMQERMIQVALSPDYLTATRRKNFQNLPPMEMASREFVRACLTINPEPLLDRAKEQIAGAWERQVSPRIYDNILITAFGLHVWAKITGRTVTKAMREHVFDASTLVDQGGVIRTPLWADEFLLDIASMIEERGPFTWGKVEKGSLFFNLRRAHAEWAKDLRARGETAPGIQPIRRQMDEDAIKQFVIAKGKQKRMLGANTRVFEVDLESLRETIDD
jgi:hypothetical protein